MFFITGEETKLEYVISAQDAFYDFSDMVWRLALSKTANPTYADDILQDVFMKFLNKKPKFQSKEHCKAWFVKVTVNCSINLLKSAFIKRKADLNENIISDIHEDLEVYSEVLKLPEKQRIAIHLHYYEGYSIEEIATFTKSNPSTVKSWLFRARKQLKQQLKGVEFDV